MLHREFGGLAGRLHVPRREWDAICNLVARQSGFTRAAGGRKGKNFERRFVRNAHFPNALMFFKILVEATGEHREELRYWEGRDAIMSHQGQQ